MGVQTGFTSNSPPAKPTKSAIYEVITGDVIQTSFGHCFCHIEEFPPDFKQGNTQLDQSAPLDLFAKWAKSPAIEGSTSDQMAFLDTETTGLSGGTGTFVFLVGIGSQTPDGFVVRQYFLEDPGEEKAFLTALSESLSGFKGVVTYNGKSFDIPILNTRFVLNGLSTPFTELGHVDLLHLVRRIWKYRLNHRNLGILETEILGMSRTSDEIPGWMVPEMYIDYCRTGDARPLKGVFYHNTMDIVSLAAVMFQISALIHEGSDLRSLEGVDVMAAGKFHESLGDISKADNFYSSALSRTMSEEHVALTKKNRAFLHKKYGDLEKSLPLMNELAEAGDWDACLELAKYHEHVEGDYLEALRFCGIASKAGMERSIATRKMESLKTRISRLRRKAGIIDEK